MIQLTAKGVRIELGPEVPGFVGAGEPGHRLPAALEQERAAFEGRVMATI